MSEIQQAPIELNAFMSRSQERVNRCLSYAIDQQYSIYVPETEQRLQRLQEAAKYSTGNGGKRLRPALIYAAAQACGEPVSDWDLDLLAAAIECIHSYSLVHDDLPAMDDDALRRGKPTCHIAYDEATAILVGDGLQSLAFELICGTTDLTALQQVNLVKLLARAAGNRGMVGGQMIDLDSENTQPSLAELESMHSLKTGALIRCAVAMGAVAANASESQLAALDSYADKIGLAFQVQDDILDIESDTETLGKVQGSDEKMHKATYPALMGLTQAKAKAATLVEEAKLALAEMSGDVGLLSALADFIIERRF